MHVELIKLLLLLSCFDVKGVSHISGNEGDSREYACRGLQNEISGKNFCQRSNNVNNDYI